MAFDFELIISGLILTALKSTDARPVNPTAVDLIIPDDNMHRTRLNYMPLDFHPAQNADMDIDTAGARIASLALGKSFVEFVVSPSTQNAASVYTVKWGTEMQVPSQPSDEEWMNWVPGLDELGFDDFTIPASPGLPTGARLRIGLPFGQLAAREVVRDHVTGNYLVWEFPATDLDARKRLRRGVANDVIFRGSVTDSAAGKGTLIVKQNGVPILSTSGPAQKRTIVQMCLSNDVDIVDLTFGSGSKTLKHLEHFDKLAPVLTGKFSTGIFQAPHVPSSLRTSDPVCNGTRYVYK